MAMKPVYLSQVVRSGAVVRTVPGDVLRLVLPSGQTIVIDVGTESADVTLEADGEEYALFSEDKNDDGKWETAYRASVKK